MVHFRKSRVEKWEEGVESILREPYRYVPNLGNLASYYSEVIREMADQFMTEEEQAKWFAENLRLLKKRHPHAWDCVKEIGRRKWRRK